MRRLAALLATILMSAALAGLLALTGTKRAGTETAGPQPQPFEPLGLDDFSIGDFLEGDAPIDRLAPDAWPAGVFQVPPGGDPDEIPAPEGYSLGFDHYASPSQINAFLRELEADYPDLVEVFEIGSSWQGRPILAARVTNERHWQPIDDRPAMYTDGQHHARELVGMELTLYSMWWLVHHYGIDPLATHLVDTRVSHFVPSVNVDGNSIVLNDNGSWRKTANPSCCDDDGDGRFDEDAPYGFGYGAHRVDRYVFDEAWAEANPDNPFVSGWRDHLIDSSTVGYFDGALGGTPRPIDRFDRDGDGETWEDPAGGVDANRNYDWHWEDGDDNVRSESYRGPSVHSEPSTAAVRDHVLELPNLAVGLSYHSGIDLILHPWGFSREEPLPDAETFEIIGRMGSRLTEAHGMPGSPHVWTARGLYSAQGSTMDWLYGARGVYAFSPEIYGGSGTTVIERVGATGAFSVGQSTAFGFNPLPQDIVTHLDRWNPFALYLLAAVPNVELNAVERDGDDLVLTLGNDGLLPVDLAIDFATATSTSHAGTAERLSHSQVTLRAPFSDTLGSNNALIVDATLAIGTVPHRVERAAWRFRVREDGSVEFKDGELVPFTDLGSRFGGWYAGEEWGERAYTCLPGRPPEACPEPIPVTPRPTATAGPTQTPRPFEPAWPTPPPRPTRTPWSLDALPWRDARTPIPSPTPGPTLDATATATTTAAATSTASAEATSPPTAVATEAATAVASPSPSAPATAEAMPSATGIGPPTTPTSSATPEPTATIDPDRATIWLPIAGKD